MKKIQITEEMIAKAIEWGWTREEASKGYGIFSNPSVMNGAEHIERIDDMGIFNSDFDAAEYAEEVHGVKIIHDLPECTCINDDDNAPFIDTIENCKIIKQYIKDRYGLEWR